MLHVHASRYSLFRFPSLLLALFLFSGAQSAANEGSRRRRRSKCRSGCPPALERSQALQKSMAVMQAEIQRLTELAKKQKVEVKACWGKKVSDACMFKGLDGVIKRGSCVRMALLWCKAAEIDGPEPPTPPPAPPEVEACIGKEAKEPCLYKAADGNKKTGFCTGEDALLCKAVPIRRPEPTSLEIPCLGKKYHDACETGSTPWQKGVCVAGGSYRKTCNYQGVRTKCWCSTNPIGGSGYDEEEMKVLACKGRRERDGCIWRSRLDTTPRGICIVHKPPVKKPLVSKPPLPRPLGSQEATLKCDYQMGNKYKEISACAGKRPNEKCAFSPWTSAQTGICKMPLPRPLGPRENDRLSCKVPGGRPGSSGRGGKRR